MRSTLRRFAPLFALVAVLAGAACAETPEKKSKPAGDCPTLGETKGCESGKICAMLEEKHQCLKRCTGEADCTELQECKKIHGSDAKACYTKGATGTEPKTK